MAYVRPPPSLTQEVRRAVREFDMIRPGDRLLLGVSGGKDSWSLLHVLAALRDDRGVPPFELAAATVDPGVDGYHPERLRTSMEALGMTWHYERQSIVRRALENMHRDSFCSYCARMRRGILYGLCRRHGYNVLVLGQHLDDVAESFLMSTFHEGRLNTMKAHYVNTAGDVRVIRPLVYVRERQTADFALRSELPVINDNCPACFREPTRRADMKALLAAQEREYPRLFQSMLAAMRPLLGTPPHAGS